MLVFAAAIRLMSSPKSAYTYLCMQDGVPLHVRNVCNQDNTCMLKKSACIYKSHSVCPSCSCSCLSLLQLLTITYMPTSRCACSMMSYVSLAESLQVFRVCYSGVTPRPARPPLASPSCYCGIDSSSAHCRRSPDVQCQLPRGSPQPQSTQHAWGRGRGGGQCCTSPCWQPQEGHGQHV